MQARWIVPLIAVTLLTSLTPMGQAQTANDPEPMFVHTEPVEVMAFDPWSESLWLSGNRAGVVKASPESTRQTLYTVPDGLPASTVRDIVPTAEHVWFGTSAGLVAFDRATETFERYDKLEDGSTMRDDVPVVHHEDETGTVWFGTVMSGLYKLDGADERLEPVPNPVNETRFAHSIIGLGTDGDEMWISAPKYGLVEWHRDTGEAEKHNRSLELLTDDPYPGALDFKGDDVWIGTGGQGALKYDRSTEMWQAFANPDNLQAQHVNDLGVRGSEVWFTTETGVARYDYQEDQWRHWNADNGFIYYGSKALAMGQGDVWASSRAGLAAYEAASKTWDPIRLVDHSNSLSWNAVSDCTKDGDRLLFATSGGGVDAYDPDEARWSDAYGGGDYGEHGLADITVPTMERAGQVLWFGTNRGLSGLNESTDEWTYYRTDGYEPPQGSAQADRINDLSYGAGTLWVASDARGLGFLEPGKEELQLLNTSDGLESNQVTDVVTRDENVWVINGGTLSHVDAETHEITHVYPKGDSPDVATAILAEGDRVWVATALKGLHLLEPGTQELQEIHAFDGMLIQTLTRDEDQLWIGGWNGHVAQLPIEEASNGGFEDEEGVVGDPIVDDTLDVYTPLRTECLERQGDLLYVGTLGGVHRYHIPTGDWLPQIGKERPTASPLEIHVETPHRGMEVPPENTLRVEGILENTSGGDYDVQARIDLGEWVHTPMHEDESFALDLPLPPLDSGDKVLTVTAVTPNADQRHATNTVNVTLAGSELAPLKVFHEPPLETYTERPIQLALRTWNTPEQAEVKGTLLLPDGDDLAFEMDPVSRENETTLYQVELSPLEDPVSAAYTIQIEHEGHVIERLPRAEDPFGSSYPLTVRERAGSVSIFEPRVPIGIPAEEGASAPMTVPLQNVGSGATSAGLNVAGEAAPWIELTRSEMMLEAHSTEEATGTVQVPNGTPAGTYEVKLEVLPRADPGAAATIPLEISVGNGASEASSTEDATRETASEEDASWLPVPGLSLGFVLALLAILGAFKGSLRGSRP